MDLKKLESAAAAEVASKRASAGLAAAAAQARLLDVAIWTVDSPLGELLVAVTPRGLLRLAFNDEESGEVLQRIASAISPRILESAELTGPVRRELDEYFSSRRTKFDLKIDQRLMGAFAQRVLSATAKIPFGSTATYGELAARVGHPGAARAVGSALGSNPVPVVVPCHRVLRAGGALGGYGGGLPRKELLLKLEGAIL